jgi:hypothetical protein
LTTALRYSGFGLAGSTPTTAPSREKRLNPSRAEAQRGGEPERKTKATNARRTGQATAAQRALKDAENALEAARSESTERQHLAEEALARRDQLRRSVEDFEVQLEELRAEETEATIEAAAAVEDRDLAEQAVNSAEQRVSRARRRMESRSN